MLTDGKRASVINAPAGSGKTRVMTEAAGSGPRPDGQWWGSPPSQSARNTLATGVAESYNTAQFLGHLPGQRAAPAARSRSARAPYCWSTSLR